MCALCSIIMRRPSTGAGRRALNYRAPALLRDAVEAACKAAGRPMRFGTMLDLGCGTGLAGEAFRAHVDWLVGVDLSPGMIAQARKKTIYDRLQAEDLSVFLAAEPPRTACSIIWPLRPTSLSISPISRRSCAPRRACSRAAASSPSRWKRMPATASILRDTLRFAHSEAHVRAALGSGRALDPVAASRLDTNREENSGAGPDGRWQGARNDERAHSACDASGDLLPPVFAQWFARRGWTPRAHQLALIEKARTGRSTLLIAPTGGGKTLAGFLPTLTELHRARRQVAAAGFHRQGHPALARPAHALYLAAEGARGRHRAQPGNAGRRDGLADPRSRRAPATRRCPSARASAAIRPTFC